MRPRPVVLLAALASIALAAACAPSHRIHPRAAEQVQRGFAHLGAGDLERAEIAFDHALEFNSQFPEALNGAALVARRHGRIARARELLGRALIARPEFAEALVNLGELDLAQGRGAAAEARFRQALAIDPDLLPARLDLARALLHRGRFDAERRESLWSAARREYLHLLESSPSLADAHHDLAFMDHESGRFDRAAESYGRAAAADPSYSDAHLGACVSLARLGRIAEARASCRACLVATPSDDRCAASLRALESAVTRSK
jgi:tetratricopeptide (TPR) repeat protein